MKYSNAIIAYNSLQNISNIALPAREAYGIYKLINVLLDEYEFFSKREKEILMKYQGTVMPDGSLDFSQGGDDEAVQENINGFINELNELREMNISIKVDPVKIGFDALGQYKITPNDIRALEGFVEFE